MPAVADPAHRLPFGGRDEHRPQTDPELGVDLDVDRTLQSRHPVADGDELGEIVVDGGTHVVTAAPVGLVE